MTYLLISSGYLGDTLHSIPILKKLKSEGHKVALSIPDYLMPAFEKIPWIDFFISTKITDLTFLRDESGNRTINVSDINPDILSRINRIPEVVVLSLPILSDELRQKFSVPVYDCKNPMQKVDMPYHAVPFAFQACLGIKTDEYKLELGFEKEDITLPTDKPNVGISLGSLSSIRRFSREQLLELLKLKYNLYVFGIGSKKASKLVEDLGATSLVNPNRYSRLATTLNYLSKMDLFISPDSGLLHCALALHVPIVLVPLQSKTPEPWMIAHPSYVPFISSCKDYRYASKVAETILQHGPVVQRQA